VIPADCNGVSQHKLANMTVSQGITRHMGLGAEKGSLAGSELGGTGTFDTSARRAGLSTLDV
jgi:hypothetical protein